MYENPDENRQIHAKCLPFFKNHPFLRESGYERGMRFDREGVGGGGGGVMCGE